MSCNYYKCRYFRTEENIIFVIFFRHRLLLVPLEFHNKISFFPLNLQSIDVISSLWFVHCSAELPGNDGRANGLIRQTFATAFTQMEGSDRERERPVARETVRPLLKTNSPDWFSSVRSRMPFFFFLLLLCLLGNKQENKIKE